MRRQLFLAFLASALFMLGLAVAPSDGARAATGSASVASAMAGNGHNVSFDGRIFISRPGNDDPEGGWLLQGRGPSG